MEYTGYAMFRCRKTCKNLATRAAVAREGNNYVTPEGGPAGKVCAFPVGKCRGCGKWLYGEPIYGAHSDKTKCGARCMNAVGPSCECPCAGENHGAGNG